MRRVLAIVPEADGPSTRFRVLQYRSRFERHGLELTVAPWNRPLGERLRALAAARAFDRVLVHRVLMTPPEALLLRRFAPAYRFDFDDALSFRDSARSRQRSWQRRAALRRMLRGASAVIAGNEYLAGLARPANARVTVVPTALDLAAWPVREPRSAGPVVGWIGTRANLMYLARLAPALGRLGRGPLRPRLKIVCDAFLDVPGIEVERKRWALADESDDVASFAVGIMPLPDDPWTRGKCGLKILQCFAAGVPVVCSPVGANLEIVRPGENGFFATSDEEWTARLEELLADEERRRRMGAAGRRTVEDAYSLDVTWPRLAAALGVEGSGIGRSSRNER